MNSASIGILGGGIAGLALARRLAAQGLAFDLFEAGPRLGGLARTLAYGDFRVDTGAHRFHDQDPDVTAWVERLLQGRWTKNHARSAILRNGRFIDFPLSPVNVLASVPLRRGLRYVWDYLRRPGGDPDNLRDLALCRFGRTLADDFVLKYSRKLWGVPTEQLSLEVGTARLRNMSLGTMVREVFQGPAKRNEHLDGSFYYPQGGFGRIAEALVRGLPPERLHVRCAVRSVEQTKNGYRVTTERGTPEYAFVAAALPLTRMIPLATWLSGELREAAQKLRQRRLATLFLTLDRPSVSPHASLYLPDEQIPITRLHEPRNRCATLAPEGQTSLLLEIPLAEEAGRAADDAVLKQIETRAVRHLVDLKLIRREEIMERHGKRLPNAYPVLVNEVLPVRRRVLEALQARGDFFCLGRGARFEYTHLHQIFRQAMDLAAHLASRLPPRVAAGSSEGGGSGSPETAPGAFPGPGSVIGGR